MPGHAGGRVPRGRAVGGPGRGAAHRLREGDEALGRVAPRQDRFYHRARLRDGDSAHDRCAAYARRAGRARTAGAPLAPAEGFNAFLRKLDVTFRRDAENFRPRINKRGSVLDREQKQAGYYYNLDDGGGGGMAK